MLIRTGGGHAARLSIPRDTVVEIPGHGLQKINAAHAFGGPAESISVIKRWLGHPDQPPGGSQLRKLPAADRRDGRRRLHAAAASSRAWTAASASGGYTLRLTKGTHHLDGKQALALARTRENLCAPNETDLQREEHQQALFTDMKSQLLSPVELLPAAADRLERAAGDHLRHERPDAARAVRRRSPISGTPPTRVLKPPGRSPCPAAGEGLTVSEAERRAAVARFMTG